jgi:hypothetical protein
MRSHQPTSLPHFHPCCPQTAHEFSIKKFLALRKFFAYTGFATLKQGKSRESGRRKVNGLPGHQFHDPMTAGLPDVASTAQAVARGRKRALLGEEIRSQRFRRVLKQFCLKTF